MKELAGLAIAILLTSVISIGGGIIIYKVTGQDAGILPGYYEGLNLTADIKGGVGDFQDLAEDDSGIGVSGIVSLVKTVLFAVPSWASRLLTGIVSFFNMPDIFGTLLSAGVYIIYIIAVGILVLRGVVR